MSVSDGVSYGVYWVCQMLCQMGYTCCDRWGVGGGLLGGVRGGLLGVSDGVSEGVSWRCQMGCHRGSPDLGGACPVVVYDR